MTDEWKSEFEKEFGAFAIMGSAGRFYNGAFANEARIREAIEFIDKLLYQATSKAREEALDDMFLEIAKLAVPDERQPSAGDLHVNMDDIHEIRKSLKKDK